MQRWGSTSRSTDIERPHVETRSRLRRRIESNLDGVRTGAGSLVGDHRLKGIFALVIDQYIA
jgi:hypothetical protein